MRCAFARARPRVSERHEAVPSRGTAGLGASLCLPVLVILTIFRVGAHARAETGAAPAAGVCEALAKAATTNDLPVDFFTRLIWQESHFKPDAVSRKGARGIAQFMPTTARSSGLENPFNPLEAIAKSGELLRGLRGEFGNLGLAAAAYNAGPARVRDWLGGRRRLPQETRAYVRLLTGRSVEEWMQSNADPVATSAEAVPCNLTAAVDLAEAQPDVLEPRPELPIGLDPPEPGPGLPSPPDPPQPKPESVEPWSVVVVGGPTPEMALARYREWQSKYPAILADREPHVIIRGILGEMGAAQARVSENSRAGADKTCAALLAAGSYCDVLRD